MKHSKGRLSLLCMATLALSIGLVVGGSPAKEVTGSPDIKLEGPGTDEPRSLLDLALNLAEDTSKNSLTPDQEKFLQAQLSDETALKELLSDTPGTEQNSEQTFDLDNTSVDPESTCESGPPYVKDEVLVRFREGTTEEERARVRRQVGLKLISDLPLPRLEHLKTAPGAQLEKTISSLEDFPSVAYAEQNTIYCPHSHEEQPAPEDHAVPPNDPYRPIQWPHRFFPYASFGINSVPAWAVEQGSDDVVVAVLDTGASYNHPDLRTNLWTNEGEAGYKAFNEIDDDGNGFVDDVHGANVVDRWPTRRETDVRDFISHGTPVAGIIGAQGDNGLFGTGVSYDVQLMPVKMSYQAGPQAIYASKADMIEGIDYAVSEGADIVNISFGTGCRTVFVDNPSGGAPIPIGMTCVTNREQALVDMIGGSDALFVVSAGDGSYTPPGGFPGGNGQDVDEKFVSPCSIAREVDNMLCVTSSTVDGSLRSIDNYGNETVGIAAPGVDVPALHSDNADLDPEHSDELLFDDMESGNRWIGRGKNENWHIGEGEATSGSFSLTHTAGDIPISSTNRVDARALTLFVVEDPQPNRRCRLDFSYKRQSTRGRFSVSMNYAPLLPSQPSSSKPTGWVRPDIGWSEPFQGQWANYRGFRFYFGSKQSLTPGIFYVQFRYETSDPDHSIHIDDVRFTCGLQQFGDGEEVNVSSFNDQAGMELRTGTSFAAPHVSGAAALLYAQRKGDPGFGASQAKEMILDTARDAPEFEDKVISGGILDVGALLNQ